LSYLALTLRAPISDQIKESECDMKAQAIMVRALGAEGLALGGLQVADTGAVEAARLQGYVDGIARRMAQDPPAG
jgi:hypothetical protein